MAEEFGSLSSSPSSSEPLISLYPWGGEIKTGNPESNVAVCTMNNKVEIDLSKVAVAGPLRTENLGIEKIIANIISNPNIRYLIVWGEEITGHFAGQSLVAIWRHGINEDGRIVDAKGAVPYIENIDKEAIERFRRQVEIVNMLGCTDPFVLSGKITELASRKTECFGKPYLAINLIKRDEKKTPVIENYALHKNIKINCYLEVFLP
ncbi:MAG: hypothetical protein QW728_05425 [Thermoplasmata archaeon]